MQRWSLCCQQETTLECVFFSARLDLCHQCLLIPRTSENRPSMQIWLAMLLVFACFCRTPFEVVKTQSVRSGGGGGGREELSELCQFRVESRDAAEPADLKVSYFLVSKSQPLGVKNIVDTHCFPHCFSGKSQSNLYPVFF